MTLHQLIYCTEPGCLAQSGSAREGCPECRGSGIVVDPVPITGYSVGVLEPEEQPGEDQ